MILYYISPKVQKDLLKQVYDTLQEYYDLTTLGKAEKDILKNKDWSSFYLSFDPLQTKSDPVAEYNQLIAPNAPDRMDWLVNSINSLLFKNPFLIEDGLTVVSGVKSCALNLLSRLNENFKTSAVYPDAIKYLLEDYIRKVFAEDFEVQKLHPDEIEIYCEKIELRERNELQKYNESQYQPVKKPILVFHVNININASGKVNAVRSFDWKGTEEGLQSLHIYLVQNNFIETIEYQLFKACFSNQPISNIKEKLVWQYKAKGVAYASGVLVDLMALLCNNNLIDNAFQKRSKLNSAIKGCFKLGDGSSPKIDDKKVTSPKNRTKTLKDFAKHLSKIPSIPS